MQLLRNQCFVQLSVKEIKMKNILTTVFALIMLSFGVNAQAYDLRNVVRDWATGTQMKQQNQQYQNQGYVNQNQIYERRGIETTQEWNTIYQAAVNAAQSLDGALVQSGQDVQSCSLQTVTQLGQEPYAFQNMFDARLPKTGNMSTVVLDVGSVKQLNDAYYSKNEGLESVTIPSIASLSVAVNGRQTAMKNASQNMAAIMIPSQLVRTAKQQYAQQGRRPEIDAQNLHEATMRDIATMGYLILKNPQFNISADSYVQAALMVYARNKMMCLYDFH